MKNMGESDNNNSFMGVTLRSFLGTHAIANPAAVKQNEDDKECSGEEFDSSAAFLGPTLWEKTLSDFKLEYMDLHEFLNDQSTNQEKKPADTQNVQETAGVASPLSTQSSTEGLSSNDGSVQSAATGPDVCDQSSSDTKQEGGKSTVPVKFRIAPGDLALATVPGHEHFDPSNHSFSEDELRPQAMVRKSRKQFVPDTLKDDKYWARRSKNNQAARRSREARRVKENQIVLRASYLEKENIALKEEVSRLKEDNKRLWQRLNKYEM